MRVVFFVALVIAALSCDSGAGSTQIEEAGNKKLDLFTTTKTFEKVGGVIDSTTVVSKIESDYFVVNLEAMPDQSLGFIAEKKLQEPELYKPFKMSYFFVSDEKGADIYFKTNADFLNFMSARNYELVTTSRLQFGYEYSFKRKS